MANLPKIRRGHGRGRGPADEPRADRVGPDVQRLEAHGLTWLNIESPTQLETAWLAEHYDFHPLDLEDVLSRRRQRAKIDEYADYLFIVLHFPRFDKRAGRLQAAELNLFVAEDLVITLPNEPLKPLSALWSRCERSEAAREQLHGQGLGLPALRDRRHDVRLLLPDPRQDRLQARPDRGRALRGRERRPGARHLQHQAGDHQLPPDREAAANHAAPARPQQPALRPQDLDIYFDDIVDKSERIWDLLENYKEVAEALEATNESVISHRVNDILRALTAISVIVLPLTLIASVFGMNVGLPGGGDPAAGGSVTFWVVVGAMLAILIGMVAYFRFKRWL